MNSIYKRRLAMYYIKEYFRMLNEISSQNNLHLNFIYKDFYSTCSGYMKLRNSELKIITCSICPEQFLNYNMSTTLSILNF